jgi:hypothetical protein
MNNSEFIRFLSVAEKLTSSKPPAVDRMKGFRYWVKGLSNARLEREIGRLERGLEFSKRGAWVGPALVYFDDGWEEIADDLRRVMTEERLLREVGYVALRDG